MVKEKAACEVGMRTFEQTGMCQTTDLCVHSDFKTTEFISSDTTESMWSIFYQS